MNFLNVVYQVKDTIFWKQITTVFIGCIQKYTLFIKSKIQFFESKSQLVQLRTKVIICCLSSQRYNFLKANHNHCRNVATPKTLFIKSKIQFFESKSQQKSVIRLFLSSCLSSQRYNFLKANHNYCKVVYYNPSVVYQVKDTIFWKQITT